MVDRYTGPLSVLAGKLRAAAGPPSLRHLLSVLGDAENYAYFVKLVRDFLPEEEPAVMGHRGASDQISAFCALFSGKYFPLRDPTDWDDDYGYGEFLNHPPIDAVGWSYENLHEMHDVMKPEYLALLLFLRLDSVLTYADELEGIRTVWVESLKQDLPAEILQRVPQLTLKELHAAVDGTAYEGVVHACEIALGETGTYYFDYNEESYDRTDFDWEPEEVEACTAQYQKAMEVARNQKDQAQCLAVDLRTRFEE